MKSEDNYELTRVGAHTPAGRMLRRYWHPVGVSADLKDTPKLVKILGEELVLFRKPDGQCGLLDGAPTSPLGTWKQKGFAARTTAGCFR